MCVYVCAWMYRPWPARTCSKPSMCGYEHAQKCGLACLGLLHGLFPSLAAFIPVYSQSFCFLTSTSRKKAAQIWISLLFSSRDPTHWQTSVQTACLPPSAHTKPISRQQPEMQQTDETRVTVNWIITDMKSALILRLNHCIYIFHIFWWDGKCLVIWVCEMGLKNFWFRSFYMLCFHSIKSCVSNTIDVWSTMCTCA